MESYRVGSLVFLASVLALAASAALAEEAILVTVDATRTQQKLLHTHLVMPVKSGPLTLYYPKWIPGEHGPDGPIANLTGLKFEAEGQTIPWQRDLLDVFTSTWKSLTASAILVSTLTLSSLTAAQPLTN
jgi:hypothetical protein